MVRFTKIICVLFVSLAALDYAFGILCNFLLKNAKHGETFNSEYIANWMQDDIVVFGSSRANHHYNPSIINSGTNYTCFNAGIDGYGIVLHWGRYKLLSKRYNPKIIIYDVELFYDLLTDDCNITQSDSSRYISFLRPYFEETGIDSIICLIDPKEKYKCLSKMYRCNSKILQMIKDNIPIPHKETNNYKPLSGQMDTIWDYSFEKKYSPLKLSLLEKLAEECCGKTELVFALSPTMRNYSPDLFSPIFTICKKYNCELLNHLKDTTFVLHPELFNDSYHLNSEGANKYTKIITDEIQTIIARRNNEDSGATSNSKAEN